MTGWRMKQVLQRKEGCSEKQTFWKTNVFGTRQHPPVSVFLSFCLSVCLSLIAVGKPPAMSPLSCHPVKKPTWRETEASSHHSENRRLHRQPQSWAWKGALQLQSGLRSPQPLWRDGHIRRRSKPEGPSEANLEFLTHRNCNIIHVCCFKPWSFG